MPDGRIFIDGAVCANDPSMYALTLSKKVWGPSAKIK